MDNKATGRAIGGKAAAAKKTSAERKALAMKMVAAREHKAKLPKAQYKGIIKIGEIEIPCAVLENGTRLISEIGIHSNFGSTGGKTLKLREKMEQETGGLIPLFLASKPLKPFIDKVFSDMDLMPIEYLNNNVVTRGYNAAILPKVCEVWLQANDAGVLQLSQLPKVKKAEILMRGLAHVGILALLDEATGYQEAREKDALAKIFEAFVAKELQPWIKTFPIEYYKELCRLYDVPFPPSKNNQFPQFFGHVTNNAIYARLAPEILPELKKAANKYEKKAKLHQFLTNDVGHPKLREHLSSIVTILKLAKDKEDFKRMLNIAHPKFNETMQFDF